MNWISRIFKSNLTATQPAPQPVTTPSQKIVDNTIFAGSRQSPHQTNQANVSSEKVGIAPTYTLAETILAEPIQAKSAGILRNQPAQKLFTRPLLRQAWLAVKRAKGGRGVDGVTLEQYEKNLEQELGQLQKELIEGSYRPHPIKQVLVPKASGGLRPIALWVLRDRIAQRAIYDLIYPSFESIFLPCSFGFRPGRGTEDAIKQVVIHRNQHLRWVVDADIQSCFDNIDSKLLMPLIRQRVQDRLLLTYLQGWLEAKILNGMDGAPAIAGASQGSVLSPLFANIYLHEFDKVLQAKKMALVRYADDLVICCRHKREAEISMDEAQKVLEQWRLQLHPQKSRITHIDQGFSWLGYFFIRNECHRL